MNWKRTALWGAAIGAGYLAYRWYKQDQMKRQLGMGDPQNWRGYQQVQADISQAKAFGAETAQTQPNPPPPVNKVMGDVEDAPEGAGFFDPGEFDEEVAF